MIVTFDDDFMAQRYVRETHLDWPLLLDRSRSLYKFYGMERASWGAIYGPASIGHYVKLMLSGRKLKRPGSDWRQLGGDVLIDPEGVVRLHFVSSSPHDRPSVDLLLKTVGIGDAGSSERRNGT